MSTPALVGAGRLELPIRGTRYPIVLPSLRDPRLHLAAVIVSLQVLGQVAFEFRLSIAQILVALVTCAVLEVAIVFRRQRVILWPASALLTANGVAFVLRVPGTEHGDWWSLRGWWIFAAAAAAALLSKYVIRFRGRHVFNPSNIGLVVFFLALGVSRADPLALWWGPMSPWLALALGIIVAGGFVILGRLHLLEIAVGFWLALAAGAAVLAASGHEMTAAWHVGPVSDWEFWRVLVFSPEILVFLFFMITDPKTIPGHRGARIVYAVGIGLLATLLMAPFSTEFATKVAVLGSLALVCAARPFVTWLRSAGRSLSVSTGAVAFAPSGRLGGGSARRAAAGAGGLTAAAAFAGLVLLAGIPARSGADVPSAVPVETPELPEVTVLESAGVAAIGRPTALKIASDVVADLRIEAEALSRRDVDRAAAAATGARLQALWQTIRDAGPSIVVPEYDVHRMHVSLEPGTGQGPPVVVAALEGTVRLATYGGASGVEQRTAAAPFAETFELSLESDRYLIARSRGGTAPALPAPIVGEVDAASATGAPAGAALGGVHLEDVAPQVGLDFHQGAFHFQVSHDPIAMMGGGLCWLDYDGDGWLDLFAVNSYSIEADVAAWKKQGGLPRSALFRNEGGRFANVSAGSGADVSLRGNGCVSADFNLDGRTDLYVTAAGYDALLWNEGDGRFSEGARDAGVATYGWHTGAAVGDVNGDGLPDLFVAGYADLNAPVPDADGGFPSTYAGVRDLLYLNEGLDASGHSRFREVGLQAGIETAEVDHGLGAVLADFDGDGRLDLYVANDLDPNRLYVNVPLAGGASADPTGLGFRFEERGHDAGVDDENAGMGVAAADFSADGRQDLFVTNSHQQLHGVFTSREAPAGAPSFADARPAFSAAFDTSLAGWGVSAADLDLDGDLDLVLANGAIPVDDLAADGERIQVFENLAAQGDARQVADVGPLVGLGEGGPQIIGRGLAAADYDNDGDVDIAVNSIAGPLVLLRNDGGGGHWLEVDLGAFSPGAVVTAVLPDGRRFVREAHAGGSYLSSEDPRLHFGLGDAATVRELIVRYPGGRETRLTDVPADRLVTVPRP